MDLIPRRHSLVSQVVEILETEIAQGRWQEWLPSERELAGKFHVSRNTLRAAVAQLQRMGAVQSVHPLGTRIVARGSASRAGKRMHTVGLLSPEPIDLFRPNVALIIDELRAQLADIGYRLRAHHGRRYFTTGPARALSRLLAENRHDCWVLVLASEEAKQWFHATGGMCVVSGSCEPEVDLPFVDLDYRALCRHAVGQMTSAGHRRLAFFVEKTTRAGIVECRRGFLEGVALAADRGVTGEVVYHQNTTASMSKSLGRLFGGATPPTAMLVTNPNHFLFALTHLQHRGRRVPQDVSLVCPDNDPFLSFIDPTPTRYHFNAHTFAQRLFRLIMLVIDGEVIPKKGIRIMPDYIKGATLAAPPRAGGPAPRAGR